MIVVKVCGCGRAYRAEAWCALPYRGVQDDGDGGELVIRNCKKCGSSRMLTMNEDRTCKAIAELAARRRVALVQASASLALARSEIAISRSQGRAARRGYVTEQLREARTFRKTASYLLSELHRLENLLLSTWRKEEKKDPSFRIGRTLVAVEGAR